MNKTTATRKNNWISEMVTRLMREEQSNPLTVGAIAVGRQVSVLYLDTERPKIGVAKCNPTDTFDLATGLAIAYARANNIPVPSYVLHDDTPFTEIGIGARFTEGGKKYIKVTDREAYCYNDGRTYTSDGTEICNVLTD